MLKAFSAEVFRLGVLVDEFDVKVASMRFGDIDGFAAFSVGACSGFARIVPA